MRDWTRTPEDLSRELTLLLLMLDEFIEPENQGSALNDLVQWFLHTPTDKPAREAFWAFLLAYDFDTNIFKDL